MDKFIFNILKKINFFGYHVYSHCLDGHSPLTQSMKCIYCKRWKKWKIDKRLTKEDIEKI
jgi:hypothetical protein